MKFLSSLKHVFIPHEGNEYKPHFFRELSLTILLIGSIFLLGFSAGSSFFINKTVLGVSVGASVLVDITNKTRIAYDEAPLVRNEKLDAAAQMKAEDMVRGGYFAHDSPEGITPWHWLHEAKYTFLYAGENLAINFTDAEAVNQAWLDSPKHRANLLDVKFKEIGIAAVDGVYKGNPTIFIVQMFGTPALSNPVALPETTLEEGNNAALQQEVGAVSSNKISLAATSSAVKGESVNATSSYIALITTDEASAVKNEDVGEEREVSSMPVTYSTWYERFIVKTPRYVTYLYGVLIFIVSSALIAMVIIEIRRQHWKHVVYGLTVMLILIMLLYINTVFFN